MYTYVHSTMSDMIVHTCTHTHTNTRTHLYWILLAGLAWPGLAW